MGFVSVAKFCGSCDFDECCLVNRQLSHYLISRSNNGVTSDNSYLECDYFSASIYVQSTEYEFIKQKNSSSEQPPLSPPP